MKDWLKNVWAAIWGEAVHVGELVAHDDKVIAAVHGVAEKEIPQLSPAAQCAINLGLAVAKAKGWDGQPATAPQALADIANVAADHQGVGQ